MPAQRTNNKLFEHRKSLNYCGHCWCFRQATHRKCWQLSFDCVTCARSLPTGPKAPFGGMTEAASFCGSLWLYHTSHTLARNGSDRSRSLIISRSLCDHTQKPYEATRSSRGAASQACGILGSSNRHSLLAGQRKASITSPQISARSLTRCVYDEHILNFKALACLLLTLARFFFFDDWLKLLFSQVSIRNFPISRVRFAKEQQQRNMEDTGKKEEKKSNSACCVVQKLKIGSQRKKKRKEIESWIRLECPATKFSLSFHCWLPHKLPRCLTRRSFAHTFLPSFIAWILWVLAIFFLLLVDGGWSEVELERGRRELLWAIGPMTMPHRCRCTYNTRFTVSLMNTPAARAQRRYYHIKSFFLSSFFDSQLRPDGPRQRWGEMKLRK